MKKHTELLRFRNKVYTRVKAVLLNDELIEGLSSKDLTRLRSIYTYDFYDTVKKLTTEIALISDKKRLKDNESLKFISVLEIQVKNILFLSKKLVRIHGGIGRTKNKMKEEQKDILYGEFD